MTRILCTAFVGLVAAAAASGTACSKRSAGVRADADAAAGGDAPAAPGAREPGRPGGAADDAGDDFAVDPFCGMRLRRSEAAASAEYDGTTHFFCLGDHRDAFLADPERALRRLRGESDDDDAGDE